MDTSHQLLIRLNDIGQSLLATGQTLALLGLGSVGTETDRLDQYSDLDFFAIVKPGSKSRFIDNLDWLETVHPLAYYFRNTVDGYKALFEDGIFCEFGVFEPQELSAIPFASGRIVWKADGFDETILSPQPRQYTEQSLEFHLGETLTNLHVGLGRVHRGEKLSGTRFIQQYAVDHVIALAKHIETAQPIPEDIFNAERRFEVRYPDVASHLPEFVQGYDRNLESALAILAFLEQHFELNSAMRNSILGLCKS